MEKDRPTTYPGLNHLVVRLLRADGKDNAMLMHAAQLIEELQDAVLSYYHDACHYGKTCDTCDYFDLEYDEEPCDSCIPLSNHVWEFRYQHLLPHSIFKKDEEEDEEEKEEEEDNG